MLGIVIQSYKYCVTLCVRHESRYWRHTSAADSPVRDTSARHDHANSFTSCIRQQNEFINLQCQSKLIITEVTNLRFIIGVLGLTSCTGREL